MAKAPERASRVRSWPAWVAVIERSGLSEADLSRAVLAAVARDPDFGRGKAMNLDRWLTEGRFEGWLARSGAAGIRPGTAATGAPWPGPPEVREAVTAALGGEGPAASYLDPAGWDDGRRVILAATRFAADRLRRDAGRALAGMKVTVEARSAGHG